MPPVTVRIPVQVPAWLHRTARAVRSRASGTADGKPNLLGDRDVEWSWVAARLPNGPGRALDVGPGRSPLGLMAAQRGFEVTAVDREPASLAYAHPKLRMVRGDILEVALPPSAFDLIINCSTVEHIGLAGRYGVRAPRQDGDLEAMARLRGLLTVGGLMLLTVPVGQDAVFAPLCRVYGGERLPRLLEGYAVAGETFWVKDGENRWTACGRGEALARPASARSWDSLQNIYGLGCFQLSRR